MLMTAGVAKTWRIKELIWPWQDNLYDGKDKYIRQKSWKPGLCRKQPELQSRKSFPTSTKVIGVLQRKSKLVHVFLVTLQPSWKRRSSSCTLYLLEWQLNIHSTVPFFTWYKREWFKNQLDFFFGIDAAGSRSKNPFQMVHE